MSALTVRNVSYSYAAKKALTDISFDLEPGAFCALLGPNGAGKSTLFSLLTRLFVPDTGQIMMAGYDLARHPRRALAKMGVVFQQQTLDLDTTVSANMRYFAALQGMTGRVVQQRIDAALDQLGMRERAGEKVRALNGGHRRRMEIARALIHQPDVLLLDEPTVGLDPATRQSITDHVHDLAGHGMLVFWATHLVNEIRLSDQVIVVHQGRILAHQMAADLSKGATLNEHFLEMTKEGGKA